MSNSQRVSGEHSILLSSVVCLLHRLSENISNCQILPQVTKILQTFDSPSYLTKQIYFFMHFPFFVNALYSHRLNIIQRNFEIKIHQRIKILLTKGFHWSEILCIIKYRSKTEDLILRKIKK